jgi:hypothetical protein
VNVEFGFGTWDLGSAAIAEEFAPPRVFLVLADGRQTRRFRTLRKLVRPRGLGYGTSVAL